MYGSHIFILSFAAPHTKYKIRFWKHLFFSSTNTNVSEELATWRILHCWSRGEGGEKQPTIYLVECIWWCTISCLAGEECVRIHWKDVPRMVQPLFAGCAKDDSIEFIKRQSYCVLEMCNFCPKAQRQDTVSVVMFPLRKKLPGGGLRDSYVVVTYCFSC